MWESLLSLFFTLFDTVLPVFNIDPKFLLMLDSALSYFVGLLNAASYVVPIDVFLVCMGVMVSVDLFALKFKIGIKAIDIFRRS